MSRGTGLFADALAERDAATLAASATLIADYVSATIVEAQAGGIRDAVTELDTHRVECKP